VSHSIFFLYGHKVHHNILNHFDPLHLSHFVTHLRHLGPPRVRDNRVMVYIARLETVTMSTEFISSLMIRRNWILVDVQ